jgi:hypothetical protein
MWLSTLRSFLCFSLDGFALCSIFYCVFLRFVIRGVQKRDLETNYEKYRSRRKEYLLEITSLFFSTAPRGHAAM